ncbi:hypothetical protein Hanom_Chr15g01406001 [Helianthus anomalus]
MSKVMEKGGWNEQVRCVPELKISPLPSPPLPSPPLHVFPNWKDYFQAKKTPFSLPSPVKWITGTPFSLPSPPLPLLSRSLEHSGSGRGQTLYFFRFNFTWILIVKQITRLKCNNSFKDH